MAFVRGSSMGGVEGLCWHPLKQNQKHKHVLYLAMLCAYISKYWYMIECKPGQSIYSYTIAKTTSSNNLPI